MSYAHPDDRNLTNLHKAMTYNSEVKPAVRTVITNDASTPIPVSLGGNDIVITGNVSIPGTINVTSSLSEPVHVHVGEVGTSGILDVPWMPIAGNVHIDGGDVNVRVISGNVNAIVTGDVTVAQGTIPWVTTGNANVVVTSTPPIVGDVNATVTSGNITVHQGTVPWQTNAVVTGDVSIGSYPPTALTAFDELVAIPITPVIQGDAIYGLDPDVWRTTTLNGGNVTATEDSTWQVSSGTSAGGYARLFTNRYMTYHPGQGSMFRWTAGFTTTSVDTTRDAFGVDNMVQVTGPIDREDGYAIGYSGATDSNANRKIGILHRRAGKAETRTLTITTAPTGSQTATITLNGVAYTVTLTASTSTAYTCAQIAALLHLNAIAANTWDIDSCGDTLTFTFYSPGAKTGTYSFSSTGAGTLATGTFSRTVAGVSPTDVWIYADQWDNQTIQFNPGKVNVFGIDMRWLGAGRVRFFMENPTTGNMELIHTRVWSSQQLVPHLNKPSLRLVYRSGTTTQATPSQNVIVTGSSVFAGIQGTVSQTTISQAWYNVDTTSRAKDTVWHLMSIQNPYIRGTSVNKTSFVMQYLAASAQGQDPSIIYIIKDCVGTSDLLVFNPLPNASNFSFAQYSVSLVSENLSLDTIANVQSLGINGTAQFDMMPYNLTLAPGETISVFISSSGAITRSSVGLTWRVE